MFGKGSRKNKFTFLALRFRLDSESLKLAYLVDFKEQKARALSLFLLNPANREVTCDRNPAELGHAARK